MKFRVLSAQKLVVFLQRQLGAYSGKSLRKALEANLCRINGRVERFGSTKVWAGDTVELAPDWEKSCANRAFPWHFEILYEDPSLQIVHKPAGWVCEEKNALKAFGPNHYLVHRLDKDTTGLLIVAKSTVARDQLMKLFASRSIEKQYLAVVDGVPREKEGICKSLLAKKGTYQGQTIWGSSHRGCAAITHWKVLKAGKHAALVLCEPKTGRTHQIRVHMAELGHPILVDPQYARSFRCPLFIPKLLLHAYRLHFTFQGQIIDVIDHPRAQEDLIEYIDC